MATGPTITARFVADTSRLTSDVDTATSTAGSRISTFAKNAAIAIGGAFAVQQVASFGRDAVNAASDLEESISKVGVVFGDSATDIRNWAKDSATSMGLSEQAALAAAGTYGNLAVSLGLPQEQAADMSQSLVGLAGDLASFNNVPVDDALKALQSGLTGETEPLKKFGVNLNEATLKAEAMALGLSDGKGTLSAAAKAQAAYSLILKQTTTAQGDFARTSDGLANQQRIAQAQWENLQAQIGAKLLPVMTTLVSVFTNQLLPAIQAVFGFLADHQEELAAVAIALGAIGAVILASMIPAFIAWAVAAGAAAVATLAAAAPFIALGAAVAAVAYLIIHNWDDIVKYSKLVWDKIVGFVQAVFNWIKQNWPLILTILTGPIGAAVWAIKSHWDQIKAAAVAVYNWLRDTWNLVQGFVTAPITAAKDAIATAFGAIKTAATETYDWIKGKFDAIAGAITGAVSAIAGAASSVAHAIADPINAVIDAWNGLSFTIPSIDLPDFEGLKVAGKTVIPGFTGPTLGGQTINFPNLPHLARGGVLNAATLFVGGEAGTEIVTPEALLRQILSEERGGDTFILNLYPRTADAADVAYGFRRLELMRGG